MTDNSEGIVARDVTVFDGDFERPLWSNVSQWP